MNTHYVYCYRDTHIGRVFYVGKGNAVHSTTRSTPFARAHDLANHNEKVVAHIDSIGKHRVEIEIVAFNLSRIQVRVLEGIFINQYSRDANLLNEVRGTLQASDGRLLCDPHRKIPPIDVLHESGAIQLSMKKARNYIASRYTCRSKARLSPKEQRFIFEQVRYSEDHEDYELLHNLDHTYWDTYLSDWKVAAWAKQELKEQWKSHTGYGSEAYVNLRYALYN